MRQPRTPTVAIVRVPDWPDHWRGWYFSGPNLISPHGDRITPERLSGILWREAQQARLAKIRQRNAVRKIGSNLVTIIRVRNDDWHRERFGSIAG